MAKLRKPLYFAIKEGYSHTSSLGRLIAVTTVKGNHFYGRDVQYGNPTHGVMRQLVARFETEHDARQAVHAVAEIEDRHEMTIRETRKAYEDAQRSRTREIRDYVAGLNHDYSIKRPE